MDQYECIFCGESVECNVTALLVVTDWEKPEEEQQDQQFFCHLDCLKKTLRRPDYLYIGE